jgi:formylmethanofuran dehydrogenase subunit C
MAKLKATRTAQPVMLAEFTWNFNDTMVNTVGNTVDFGAVNLGGAAGKFDVINLPVGAVVVGGSLTVETAFDTAGYDVTVGDSGSENRYLTSTDVKSTGQTALVPTGYHGTGQNIRITMSSDDACTTGKATLRVEYVIDGRATEVNPV